MLEKLDLILKSDDNYLTFTLAVVAALVAIIICWVQMRRGDHDRRQNATAQTVDRFGDLLDSVEGKAVQFWMGVPNSAGPQPDHAELVQLGIMIKSLTTIAQKLVRLTASTGTTISYPGHEFSLMRNAVTYDADLHLRPMNLDSYRILMIQDSCQALRRHFGLVN